MTQICEYRKQGTDNFFVAYDFERVDNSTICDEIASDCQMMIIATKVIAVALIAISLASLFFTTIGVLSFVLPGGILATGVSLWTLTELATFSFLADFAPICFLSNTLQTLIETQNHYQRQISLAENRKVEILGSRFTT